MKMRNFVNLGWAALLYMAASPLPLAAASLKQPVHTATALQGPKIKVLLEKEAASAFLEAKGSYRVIKKDTGSCLSSGKFGKRFVVHALQDGLRWGEEYPDVYQIAIIPLSPETTFLVNGIQYKGSISVYHVRNNQIVIVNELPIEDFVKSTLTVKHADFLSKETLAALAIAERTEAYAKIIQNRQTARPWDITATESCYFGMGILEENSSFQRAVDWTRFMVLESQQYETPLKETKLIASQVEEWVEKGWNAQKILRNLFPDAEISTIVTPEKTSLR